MFDRGSLLVLQELASRSTVVYIWTRYHYLSVPNPLMGTTTEVCPNLTAAVIII